MRQHELISIKSWVCVFVTIATINVFAHAESKKEIILPLTMSIDHEDYLSSLYIRCKITTVPL